MPKSRRNLSLRERLEDLTEAPGLKPQLCAGDIPERVGYTPREEEVLSRSQLIARDTMRAAFRYFKTKPHRRGLII